MEGMKPFTIMQKDIEVMRVENCGFINWVRTVIRNPGSRLCVLIC